MEPLKGPGQPDGPSIDLEVPSCVKIVTEEDAKEFSDFIAKIIEGARQAWSKER